jgi:hypothetical protein
VHRNASDVVVNQLALSGVQSGANLDAERPHRIADGAGTADGARRPIDANCRQHVADVDVAVHAHQA